jgi:2-keto-4-pentenoate hydratase/2-oxohepta-3-ene-1,7-dioic acid hydratase in catechol pathway
MMPMSTQSVRLVLADGSRREVAVRYLLNAGYAGRDAEQVQHHVDELAALGVRAPKTIPTLYPLPAHLAAQASAIQVPHRRTSGEAEWALVVGDDADDLMLTAACDHTDRDLEAHGVAWSKQTCPDILGEAAWYLSDIVDELDAFTLRAWVTHGATESLIQDGRLAQLLSPAHWVAQLEAHSLLRPGTVLLGGTVPMTPGVDQFADAWRVELADPAGRASTLSYRLERLPSAWE